MSAVLFDAMGTLVELEDPVGPLRQGLRERAGVEVDESVCRVALRAEISFYRTHHGRGDSGAGLLALREDCGRVLRAALGPPASSASLAAVTAALVGSLRFRAHADAAPALSRLRACGMKVAVVSDWDVSLDDVLGEVGLRDQLDEVVTSAGAGARKPDPRVFRHALSRLGCAPAGALHVGDRMREDVGGARAAGVRAVLLRRGGGPVPAGVQTVNSLAEVPALIS